MAQHPQVPNATGQLVWCPSDPSLGTGVVTQTEGSRVTVRFSRLQEDRIYTTRTADLAILRYEISAGERVTTGDGQQARVRRRLAADGAPLMRYELDDGSVQPESLLLPRVRDIGAKERLASLNLSHPEVVRARMQGLRLGRFGARPGDAAVLGARVQWLPHQVDVATRAVQQDPVRLLLADEVGLGKTVEAALIYAGLRHEGRANRVLIITPDALCIQWLGEIYRKAHELLVLLDRDRLDDAERDFPELSPFDAYQRMVASMDRLVADPQLCRKLAAAQWDLVIVDEAHHLRWRPQDGGNPAYRLVETVAARSRHLLLLTATPMALDPTEYHALLRLLEPTRFDDPVTFQSVAERASSLRDLALEVSRSLSTQRALPKAAIKAAKALLADDSDDTAALGAFLAEPAAAKGRMACAEPVLEALRQRHGLTDYVVRNRRGPVGGMPRRVPQVFALQPTAAQEVLLEVGEAVMFDLANSMPAAHRGKALGELLRALWATPRALADILRPYSKTLLQQLQPHIDAVIDAPNDAEGLPTGDARLRWLMQRIHGLAPGDKLLLFVESAVAVRALRDALEPLLAGNLAMFHRELSPRDQDRQVAYFRDPAGPQIMLCTESGGEGRNFQFCHQVVLYDLPWRPATVEQRIGRIDRVGQNRDIHVLVPYFASGYEAAVLKIMQQSIGVLQRTVGGIDHGLEYVSEKLAELMLRGAEATAWKQLFMQTHELVEAARQRVDADADPILDHASFSPARAQAVLDRVPQQMEARTEAFVQRYADHSRLELHARGLYRVAIEGAPGAAGRDDQETGYVGTFSRHYALDHEDVEFLSFGHPLVTQALQWAEQAHDTSAALALCRGCSQEGAIFLWSFDLDLPDDAPEARAYFTDSLQTFALDEAGKRRPEYESLLDTSERPLDRMDPGPLRGAAQRWRALCEQNFGAAEEVAAEAFAQAVQVAKVRAQAALTLRARNVRRAHARALQEMPKNSKLRPALVASQEAALQALQASQEKLLAAVSQAQPHLVSAMAVRLIRTRQVSG
jgi:ATP-dependent helicase HepA